MEVERIFVAGAGTMGNGIAQVAAQAGFRVTMWDVDQACLERGMDAIRASLGRLVKKGTLPEAEADAARGRIVLTTERAAAGEAELVLEAIVEDLAVKKTFFAELGRTCREPTILATNTSSLPVTEMAMASGRPDRFVGMHFFNPVPVMKLLEVVATPRTSEATVATAIEVGKRLGQTPLRAKDTPGFLFNRLIIPYLNEAAWAVYEGVGTPEDIDAAMKLGGNMPIGPLALLDLVGIDVQEKVCDVFYRETGDPKFRCCPLVRQMVRAGFHGRKSGKGFYEYGEGR